MKALLFLLVLIGIVAAALGAEDLPLVVHAINQRTGAAVDLVPTSIMSDSTLRMWCICGSLAGAAVSLALFQMKTLQEMASKVVCCSLSGIMFTPIIMHWTNANLQLDYVLAYSGAVSLCSWTVLQVAVPMGGDWFTKWFAKWFGSKTA